MSPSPQAPRRACITWHWANTLIGAVARAGACSTGTMCTQSLPKAKWSPRPRHHEPNRFRPSPSRIPQALLRPSQHPHLPFPYRTRALVRPRRRHHRPLLRSRPPLRLRLFLLQRHCHLPHRHLLRQGECPRPQSLRKSWSLRAPRSGRDRFQLEETQALREAGAMKHSAQSPAAKCDGGAESPLFS
jgi:hypothetical protein